MWTYVCVVVMFVFLIIQSCCFFGSERRGHSSNFVLWCFADKTSLERVEWGWV